MKFWLIILILLSLLEASAQDLKGQFNQYKFQHEKQFEKASRQQDSIFAITLTQNWQAIQVNEEMEKKLKPKPQVYPKIDETFELKHIEHTPIEAEPKLMRSFSPSKLEYYESGGLDVQLSFEFYGEHVSQFYPSDFVLTSGIEVNSKEEIAAFWLKTSKTNYQSLVSDLLEKKSSMQLPDFGYLLYLRSFLESLGLSSVDTDLYSWFLMQKSGFEVRIGLIDGYPVLVMASRAKVYGYKYYQEAGLFYYLLTKREGQFESYYKESKEMLNVIDFSVDGNTHLPLAPEMVSLSLSSHTGQSEMIEFYYNKNLTDMLTEFPQVSLKYYLNSSGSDLFNKSITKSIAPYMVGLNEHQKAEFLLKLVQTGFEYKSDTHQFGREKVMFPEEFLAHGYSDCDDRVVFLAYLLKTFTDIPMIVLEFPQHVALGLRLPGPDFGESISYKGFSFTVCDPTYFGAPLGAVIPSANRSMIKVIEF